MKKLLILLAFVLVAFTANAQEFSFKMKIDGSNGVFELTISTSIKKIKVKYLGIDYFTINYKNVYLDVPEHNDMSDILASLANHKIIFHSSDAKKIKMDTDEDLENIVSGKYGDLCIMDSQSVILIKGEDKKFILKRIDNDEKYIEAYTYFLKDILWSEPEASN